MILTDERRERFLPLTETSVPTDARERLAALGITTLDELRDVWAYGNRQLLVEYLGESPLRFANYPPPAGVSRGAAAAGPGATLNLGAAGRLSPLTRRPRGVLLTATQRRTVAEPPEPLAGGARGPQRSAARRVSLAADFPAPRDQGQRGTCVAFASAALLEFHLYAAAPAAKRHSEQFVYWACKQRDGLPMVEGTYVRVGRQVLQRSGACYHRTWRYQPLPIGSSEDQGPPPDTAEQEAAQFVRSEVRRSAATDPARLCQSLDERRPVVLSVKTFSLWDLPLTEQTGEIGMPLPGELPDGAHAVCLVGYEIRPELPGGGVFIFRNSWGARWARPSGRFGGGYGSLLFGYVKKYALEAFA